MSCPCGSNQNYETCCGPFIEGTALPPTAEKLMRSRYTAYTRNNIDYIQNTLAPESREDFDPSATKKWASESQWEGLKIVSTDKGAASETKGIVEFIASYSQEGQPQEHHETSQFRKDKNGQWYFVEGKAHLAESQTMIREAPKVGRNDPCTCGSGKKFKKCCG